jgi:hypothetical protein
MMIIWAERPIAKPLLYLLSWQYPETVTWLGTLSGAEAEKRGRGPMRDRVFVCPKGAQRTAMASISTSASLGRRATSTALRAGGWLGKNAA